MSYVVAGYVVVLSLLFLYAAQLVWRRRRLTRAARRVGARTSHGDDVRGSGTVVGADTGPPGR
jgi:hypothetical protein